MHVVVENLSSEERMRRLAHVPVQGNSHARLNLFRRFLDPLGGEEIQHTQLIAVAETTPSIAERATFVERKIFECWCWGCHLGL